jgi:APA family basic amino acid/polyamine antiporter
MVRPYKAWGYPVTPIVFILFALWLLYNTAREQPADVAMSTLLVLAGLPLYWWQRRLAARVATAP